MKKILPVLLALLGIGAGVGTGFLLRPKLPPDVAELETSDPCGPPSTLAESALPAKPPVDPVTREYVRMNNQFIVPVVLDERINALVVLSLSLEIAQGQSQLVFDREPKLRDAFLQVLFNHANMGGFRGAFTENANMAILRRSLRDAGQAVLGDLVSDILITDLARQDT